MERKEGGRVKVDGAYVKFLTNYGSLKHNMKEFPEAFEA
jgi:large subunit ribosomal protein L10e